MVRFSLVKSSTAALCLLILSQVAGAQPAPSHVTINDVFPVDGSAPNPMALQQIVRLARQAQMQTPGNCPWAKITLHTPGGDPLFQHALAQARRDSLLQALEGAGVSAAGRVFIDSVVQGNSSHATIETDLAPPSLFVVWDPPSGTKVKIGQTIHAEVQAIDDASQWESGVMSIILVDLTGQRPFGFQSFDPPAEGECHARARRQLRRSYTVPADAPRVVRLQAKTVDFTGKWAEIIGEFPVIANLRGSIEFSETLGNGRHWGRYDVTLNHDDSGNLKGQMTGYRHWEKQTTPSRLSANLVGKFAGDHRTLSLRIVDPQQTAGTFNGHHPWGGGLLWVEPLQRQFLNLSVANDGSIRSTIEVWGERWNLTLRRAPD